MGDRLPQIGFCGLGAMGGGMARNLVKRGFPVTGYDLYQPLVDKFVAVGGQAARSPSAAAADAEFLILMVVNDIQVDSVLFDPESGAVQALGKNTTIILCSTTPPQYLKKLRAHIDGTANRPDIRLLDCPVSGGSIRAANGTLSIFSSGPDSDLDHASTVLAAMSDPLYRIPGGISMGSVAKMCHQHQAAVNIIMASEAMGLAAVVGLNTVAVYDAINASQGRTWMFENRGPHMLANDWLTVHSAVSIILKDTIIVTDHARATGFPLVLENTAQQLYITGCHAGFTKEDDAGLVRLYLPADKHELVGNLATEASSTNTTGKGGITIDTIIDIMAGVNLASTLECLTFAKHVGLDIDLLGDIVIKGAGSSAMFESALRSMLKAGSLALTSVPGAGAIRDRLESALEKTAEIHQPLPMASAALQQLYFEIL
jgi:3-hydroxyisobutyrate dehydrogenase